VDGLDVSALVTGGGPWAIIAIGILALIRGDIVARKTHAEQIEHRDRIIQSLTVDRDYYREQTLALLRVADTAADRMTQALLSRSVAERGDHS
jgi:hypothetical protein